MLMSLSETRELLKKARPLMVAGKREDLGHLPMGNWIGGTIPYLIQNQGEELKEEQLDVTQIPDRVEAIKIKIYNLSSIPMIRMDGYPGGFSLVILPAESAIHHSFAMNSRYYAGDESTTLVGWVSGYPLDQPTPALVVYGPKQRGYDDRAVVIHCKLRDRYRYQIEKFNVFKPGNGPIIEFPESGFSAGMVKIDGKTRLFSNYLEEEGISIEAPLIALGEGGGNNVSFKAIQGDRVRFYAPVFKDFQYRQAEQPKNYHQSFMECINQKKTHMPRIFSCNCILNYSYSDLTGKNVGDLAGPVTFGEIWNGLMNQTCISLSILPK